MRKPPFAMLAIALAASVPAAAWASCGWMREWTATGYLCADCSVQDRARLDALKGAHVVFGKAAFTNPFYENCDIGADYADIKPQPAATAGVALPGLASTRMKSSQPLTGTVRCAEPAGGPPNTVARVLIDTSTAYLLDESGAVIILK